MKTLLKKAATLSLAVLLSSSSFSQSAKAVRGASPYVPLKNEPAPKLIVDQPIPEILAFGVVLIQYRTENVRIVPVFGPAALSVSPRVGHLHVFVDDSGMFWAEASDTGTIDFGGLPPGPHKVRIELVDPNHNVFSGCAACRQTVTFTMPAPAAHKH